MRCLTGSATLQRFSSIFSRLLQPFPSFEFEQAGKKHRFQKGRRLRR
jgi:hypothetical protein